MNLVWPVCRVAGGNKYAMKELESKLTKQLNDLVAMVRMKLDKQVRAQPPLAHEIRHVIAHPSFV